MLIIGRAESLPIWCTIPTVNWEIFTVKNNSQFAGTTKIKHVKYFFQWIIKTLKIYSRKHIVYYLLAFQSLFKYLKQKDGLPDP